ncbi:MAG: S46 family peptidase, partial [Bacteroidales bacterium]|nr:S46 family peptidase [Bacteroidales bacterium]
TYMRGQMEFNKTGVFYPDANSTLRITYGAVKGYKPNDAVYFKHISTLEGIMEKDNPDIYDYNIPQKLRDVYAKRDFGRWEVNGTVPVCFIATNHTSGGNSGSPVINADGELVGINFDRVWEGTMSDIAYDPQMCRNISLDIRYVLFIVDKVARASHLIEEMKIAD